MTLEVAGELAGAPRKGTGTADAAESAQSAGGAPPAPGRLHLLARYWQSARGFWLGKAALRSWPLGALLVAILLLQILVQYLLNYWNRDFFNALDRRQADELWSQTLRFVPLVGFSIALAVASTWGKMTVQRRWRAWLSTRLYDYWLGNGRFRKLRFIDGEHDAPEFRIAEDVRVATDLPIELGNGLLTAAITAVTFIGVLASLSGELTLPIGGTEVAIPGYLVIAAVLYSGIITGLTLLVGRNLTRVHEENKHAEAELRSTGSHLRAQGEGTAVEEETTNGRRVIGQALRKVVQRWVDLCWQLMRTTLVSHGASVLTPVVGLLLCTPRYLAGGMTLGEVVQASAAFVVVHGAFNWITDNFGRLADCNASINRVATLLLALDQVDDAELPGEADPGEEKKRRARAKARASAKSAKRTARRGRRAPQAA